MTKPPKWWNANGPPSPTTPLRQLEIQNLQDQSTKKSLTQNRFHDLDNEADEFLYKHQLSDGTFVFTTHPSVKKLHRALKTTRVLKNKKKISCTNPPKKLICENTNPNSLQPGALYSPNTKTDEGFITVQKSPRTNKTLHPPILQTYENKPSKRLSLPTTLKSTKFVLPTKNLKSATRLLYPKTKLPPSLPSLVMPIFKSRLHRTNTLRKLFEDVQLNELTVGNAQILHQRALSMALKPVLPGYHLKDPISLDDMIQDLSTTKSHNDIEIKTEKSLGPEEKARKDEDFDAFVEVARSLLPNEMSLDIKFPIHSLIGLTHDEAVSLLRNHYEAAGIPKTPGFFKKRDSTFYLNEIFGILDQIHSEHTNNLATLHTQTPSEHDHEASIVTPILSPSKKRKADTETKGSAPNHLDFDNEHDVFVAMNELTWDTIQIIPKDTILTYIQAYMTRKNIDVDPHHFDVTPIDDLRETLTIYTIELHTETSFSAITTSTTDDDIDAMDPIWAYFEYFDAYLDENDDVAHVLFIDIDDVRMELRSARDKLCMQNTSFEEDEDEDSIEQHTFSEDVHMFYPGLEDNEFVDHTYRNLNAMFLNTMQYHKDNACTDETIDQDLLTIVGILSEQEIQMISDASVHLLLRSAYRKEGNDFPIEHFRQQDIQALRSELVVKNKYINDFRTVSGRSIQLGLNGMSKRDVEFVSKECGQVILYRYYKDTDNSFRNTFGQDSKNVTAELKRLVRETIKHQTKNKTSTKKKKQQKSTLPTSSSKQSTVDVDLSIQQPTPALPTSASSTTNASDTQCASDDTSNTNNASPPPASSTQSTSNSAISKSAPPSSNFSMNSETSVQIIAQTTDEEIETMTVSNARSEYFRLSKANDPNLTVDSLLGIPYDRLIHDLKLLRDNLLQLSRNIVNTFTVTSSTTDAVIEMLTSAQCISALNTYAATMGITIASNHLQSLTRFQLLVEVTKARDQLKNNASLSIPSDTNAHTSSNDTPSSPTTNQLQKQLVGNLVGIDSNKLDPHQHTEPKASPDIRGPPKPVPDEGDEKGHTSVSKVRTTYTIHAKLGTGGTNFSIPSTVRKLIVQLRKGDSLLQIVPIDVKNTKISDILDRSIELPDEETRMKTWVDNIRTVGKRLFCTMKVKTVDIEQVKTAVFAWCKGTNNWVDFTKLESTKIFTGGWFYGIHPFYYNRDDFADYLFRRLPGCKDKLDIYQKKVHRRNEKNEKMITVAIVIDGAFEIKDKVLNFLYTHKFGERYSNVSFVPYASNDEFSKQDQVRMILSNNKYQHELSRIIIKVNGATTLHTINGETFNFQDWLYNTTIDQERVIKGVEVAPDNVVRVLFHKDDAEKVKHVIHNLYSHAEDVFGPTLTATMLDKANLERAKSSSDMAREHSLKLKQISGNPQGPDDATSYSQPKKSNARGHYGTYLEVAQGNATQTSEVTYDATNDDNDLRKQVHEIAKAQKQMENSLNSTISSVVTEKLKPMQQQITSLQTSQNKVDNFISMMEMYVKSTDERYQGIQASLISLGAPAQTPSEAAVRPPGVRK